MVQNTKVPSSLGGNSTFLLCLYARSRFTEGYAFNPVMLSLDSMGAHYGNMPM